MGLFVGLVIAAFVLWALVLIRRQTRLPDGSRKRDLLVVFPEDSLERELSAKDLDFIRSLELPRDGGLEPPTRPRATVQHAGFQPADPMQRRGEAHTPEPVPSRRPVPVPEPVMNGYGDPTLQLLPGRLEVLAGFQGDAIRFIKQPGSEQEITLGRTGGPSISHVQLPSPTVSRMHAKMRYQNGTWVIENLSETNPVCVNGRAATGEGAECVLSDGDRIEMGEVALLFRKR